MNLRIHFFAVNWKLEYHLFKSLIVSSTFHYHLFRFETVVQKLRETGLKVKMKKCNFLKPEVRFLGHQVSAQGIVTDLDKISAMKRWPVPCTVKDLRSFLWCCSYYRMFIECFSLIAGPLHDIVNVYTTKSSQASRSRQPRNHSTCRPLSNSKKS